MKLVKFKDGTFGVRRLTLYGYRYLQVIGRAHFWFPLSRLATSTEYWRFDKGTAQKLLDLATDKGVVE